MTKTKSISKQFEKTREDFWNKLAKKEEKLEVKMGKVYERYKSKLEKEIAEYFGRYGKNNVIEYADMMEQLGDENKRLLLADYETFLIKNPDKAHLAPIRESIYKLTRLEGLQYSVLMNMLELGVIEEEEIRKHLISVFGETYKGMSKVLGVDPAFNVIDKRAIEVFLEEGWVNGNNFVDSVYQNKGRLAEYISDDFKDGIIRGDNYRTIYKRVADRFDRRLSSDIRRVVFTEGTHISNEAMIRPFEEHGLLDEYKYIAVMDSKTTDICRGLNGKVFKLEHKEVGVNFPPMHTYCRSTFNIVIPDDYIKRYVDKFGEMK